MTQKYNHTFDCVKCHQDWSVRIALLDDQTIDYFCIYNDQFYVEQCYELNHTRIFQWLGSKLPSDPGDDHWKFHITINEIPKVTPSTAKSFVNRILNLKAFY